MEMADTFAGGMFDPAGISYQAAQKINAINLNTLTKLAGLQFDLATLGFTTSVAQAKLLTAAESYRDLYLTETRLASDYSSRLMEISRETTGLLLASHDEFVTAIEGVFDVAKDEMLVKAKIVTAGPAVKKSPAKSGTKRKQVKKN
jgi:phasin family protein